MMLHGSGRAARKLSKKLLKDFFGWPEKPAKNVSHVIGASVSLISLDPDGAWDTVKEVVKDIWGPEGLL
jgi:hypothetical protein